MIKRIFSFALALVLTAAVTVPTLSLTASASNVATGQRFTDVSPDAWYYEAVTAMADAGIVNGVGNGKFEPTRPMTAGELAAVLWNMMYGDLCKATELYNLGNNGYFDADYMTSDYPGPHIGNWGTPVHGINFYFFLPATWDGAVSLMIYGDSRIDPHNGNAPYLATGNDHTGVQLISFSGRYAGRLYHESNFSKRQSTDQSYSRDMSGLAIVAMSKEYVTRGFAISELVNVLRETGNLEPIYNASNKKNVYATGASIPDWADITNVYHDVCSASVKSSGDSFANRDHDYLFHDYTWAWNYIDEPGNIKISGGYANTWFSADVLLAYQAGIVSGKDASGRCDVGASMTRAEVCQMLYNAGGGKISFQPKGSKSGGQELSFSFVRDNKLYWVNTSENSIQFFVTYDPNSDKDQAFKPSDGTSYYVYYPRDNIDIRQQEWPTHPEFWGN